MSVLSITCGSLSAKLSTKGGCLLRFDLNDVPLLRPARDDASVVDSACYPMVPFGNRIRGNRFTFCEQQFELTPNTTWDPHYVHGEGWQSDWTLASASEQRVVLKHNYPGTSLPYVYEAEQEFVISDRGLQLSLSVTNHGQKCMPFGIGWHPYFPLTRETLLQTVTEQMWSEDEGWLPGVPGPVPEDLNFTHPCPIPKRWVNNGFSGWSGRACITWPELRVALDVTVSPVFNTMFLFVSDTSFDPSYRRDYFALEPMSHLANGHNMPDLGGLTILSPGESLSGSMVLCPSGLERPLGEAARVGL